MESLNINTSSIRKKMGLQSEQYDVWKQEHQQYYCNLDWMRSGGQILWNAIAFCDMSKISYADGENSFRTDRFWEPLKGPIIPFGAMNRIFSDFNARDQARLHQFGKQVLPGIFLGYALIAGGFWKGNILIARHCIELETDGRYRKFALEGSTHTEILNVAEERTLHIPSCRWTQQNCQESHEFLDTHSKAGTTCREWRSQRSTWSANGKRSQWRSSRRIARVLNRQNQKMTGWSHAERLLVDRHKVTSFIVITMNLEFNSMCRKKKHSRSRCNISMLLDPLTMIWTWCKKSASTTIWMSTRTGACQIRGLDWRSLPYWEKNTSRMHVVGETLTKIQATTRPDHAWLEVCTKICKSAQKREKGKWAKERPKLDNARKLKWIYVIDPEDKKNQGRSWKRLWKQLCFARSDRKLHEGHRKLERNWKHPKRFQRQNTGA